MVGKFFRESYHLILFVVYVLLANLILRSMRYSDEFVIAYSTIGLSLLGAGILSIPTIVSFIKTKGHKKIIVRNLIFGVICLVLSLSRLWVYTVLARLSISPFLLSLSTPIFLENVLPFCAGLYFVRSLSMSTSNGGAKHLPAANEKQECLPHK